MNKQSVGRKNFYDGLAAEAGVERKYCDSGGKVAARRWRGAAGEVDLIIRKNAELIFVEVKKTGDFARAAESLSIRQLARIASAAEEFVGAEPQGSLTPFRVDLALVDGRGECRIIENVTM